VVGEEFPLALASRVASLFDLPSPLEPYDFPERGNIHHHTFLIQSGGHPRPHEYLLQRINQQVFTCPPNVMAAMISCLEAQQRNLERGSLMAGQGWEPIRLIPTRAGWPYLTHETVRGTSYWRVMVKIPECVTYKSLGEVADRRRRIFLAEEAGRGLAIYGDLTADMDVRGLASPLPGYRDTGIYYRQLRSVLSGNRSATQAAALLPADDAVRNSTARHFLVHLPEAEERRRREDPELRPYIDLACSHEEYAMTLLREMASGRIRTVAIHGDTKLDNFLFCAQSGRVRSLVDLDTITAHTWLADWGDMVRSLANIAGEKERDVGRIQVDMEIYDALARGFLLTARRVTAAEIDLMADAVQVVALELGVRFLSDYLRGDSYFKLGLTDPPDTNKYRAMVQLNLFRMLKSCADEARRRIARLAWGRR